MKAGEEKQDNQLCAKKLSYKLSHVVNKNNNANFTDASKDFVLCIVKTTLLGLFNGCYEKRH
jgi:hypothetical protein